MITGFQTFQKNDGRVDIGSSRIRAEWVAKYWEEAEIYKYGKRYDAIIYQKTYQIEHAKVFNGIKIFDLCDPDCLHWAYRTVEMINQCDAVTTSTKELKELIENYTDKPVVHIPDRHDLEFYKKKKEHKGNAKNVAWFGYSTGFPMLDQVLPAISKLKLGLIVVSDKPYILSMPWKDKIEIENYTWNIRTVNDDIMKADMVVNPQAKKGKWKYKSNNKTISSNLLNIPVAESLDQMELLCNEDYRRQEAGKQRLEAEKLYDVKVSVKEYKDLINKIKKEKNA